MVTLSDLSSFQSHEFRASFSLSVGEFESVLSIYIIAGAVQFVFYTGIQRCILLLRDQHKSFRSPEDQVLLYHKIFSLILLIIHSHLFSFFNQHFMWYFVHYNHEILLSWCRIVTRDGSFSFFLNARFVMKVRRKNITIVF